MNTERTLVLIPDPVGGAGVALTLAELTEGRRRARELTEGTYAGAGPVVNGNHDTRLERLLDAQQLAAVTGVAASFWENGARQGTVPHRKIGRYRRYLLSEINQCPAFQQHSRRAR